MNERIKLLAEQARKEFLELPTGYRPEQVGMYPQLMEKFAELIVAECIRAVDNVGGYNEEFHMNAIKEHFGVDNA